jgi:hypothetical protein
MLSYKKFKMTLKNKQQEEQKTKWRTHTHRKTQDAIMQTRNKKKKWSKLVQAHGVCTTNKTIESDNDNAQWEQWQHCTNDESEKKMTNGVER